MRSYDCIIVGSGTNALVAAAMLGRRGLRVLMLQRSDCIGGWLCTERITESGFFHDVMATTMVLFVTSPARGALGKDLEARGLEFAYADLPTVVLRPNGANVILILPAEPTVCVRQPASLDPNREPDGRSILWLLLPEAPPMLKGDAAGEIDIPADGRWTEAVRQRNADRVLSVLESHIEDFQAVKLKRRAYCPADLKAMNMNLAGGDPYGGFCGLDQTFLWRPFRTSVNHRTHISGLYHIGASAHPGPGLGGGSGFLVAPF
jgi:phytoene dehydrogenase-like protein